MFEADNPTSPLFLVLLAAFLLDVTFAWSGLVRGQIFNMRTSLRGARVGGVMFVVSLVFVVIAFQFYWNYVEFFGSIALAIAGGLFAAGFLLAERIPD
ncbi:MAG: hypothetical protein HY866_04275 [Chloroflexi bacterium]|nr:hypothetical protein [Chloroflexota bacterium]